MTLPGGNVMVLGGGGFIGSSLVARLLADGKPSRQVIAVDVNFPEFRADRFGEAVTATADLRDLDQVRKLVDAFKPNMVFQFAADMGGVEYFHSDADWQAAANNGLINYNVMSAVTQFDPTARVLFTSTACALAIQKQTHEHFEEYPEAQDRLKEEDVAWGTPDQLYGQEKRNSAIMWANSPLDARVVFLHTVYGPGQEFEGIRMKFPSAVCQKARKARETNEMPLLGDGRQVRTYMYIDDALDRLLRVAGANTSPGLLQIGGTKEYTVDETARLAGLAAGVKDPTLTHVDGPTGVEHRGCDMARFYSYFPEMDPIKSFPRPVSLGEGFKRFIDWLDEVDG